MKKKNGTHTKRVRASTNNALKQFLAFHVFLIVNLSVIDQIDLILWKNPIVVIAIELN